MEKIAADAPAGSRGAAGEVDAEKYLWIYLAVVNAAGFFLMQYDKQQAKGRRRRVSERRIFAYAALGGAAGVLAGMLAFRHKTRHWRFRLWVPALIVLNAACVYWALKWWG